ncbi:MAG: tRNA (adenosine(37)-N6)-threonylcarbamoyltransferase complex ATPase subunit type 1 TsaE [Actinobacteria bacterium]|nr:MAG: tRNA (adenosine(37)-N6)-threonylcarbamoyltransferase complex ATPase subunit type 1 TsaE [Actinomycetota bacterium]
MVATEANSSLTSHSSEETRRLGACLAPLLQPGDVIVLTGDLGAGKTVFAKGIADGLGASGEVTSPTFVILHQLKGRLTLYHFDLYRLESAKEFVALGFDDILYGDGVSVLEWGDKFPDQLPSERLELVFHFDDGDERRIEVRAEDERWQQVVREWTARC